MLVSRRRAMMIAYKRRRDALCPDVDPDDDIDRLAESNPGLILPECPCRFPADDGHLADIAPVIVTNHSC